jgi:hypothetical protein
MDVTQPSEPLGDCYNLGDLERAISRAINRYGAATSIYGDGEGKVSRCTRTFLKVRSRM